MPTAEYYQAIKLLNDKYEDNWIIAMDMCSEEEKTFIREAVGASENAQDGLKEITFTKRNDGLLERHRHIHKHHPEYSNILVSNDGRIFQIKKKVSESDCEVTYIVAKRNRISYNESGNGRIAIFSAPVLIKNLVYDTFIGGRNKGEEIVNINGNKRDNRVDNLKVLTPLDRFMSHELYQHLDKIIEMRKQKITFEKMSEILGVNVPALKHFVQKAKKLGVIE